MRRRQFISALAGVTAAGAAGTTGTKALPAGPAPQQVSNTGAGQTEQMLFASTSGLLAADGGR